MREAAIEFQLNSLKRMAEKIATLIQDLESMQDEAIEKVNQLMCEQNK